MTKKLLPEISLRTEELDKCVHCGLCQSVCPTYLVRGFEGLTARGKIMLLRDILDGRLDISASIADLFDDCLTCYACQTVCPAGVKTEKLWAPARQDLAKFSTTNRWKRWLLGWTIGKPKLFEKELKLAAFLKGFDKDNSTDAKLSAKWFPVFKGAPYLESLKVEYPATGKEIGSVGLLLGCSSNFSTPWIADAVIKLLTASGYRVVIPKEQVCCGAPAINNGNWSIARRLAKRNIKLFNELGVDYITSGDGTCTAAFSDDYKRLFSGDSYLLKLVNILAERTVDLSTLLARAVDREILKFQLVREKVTLHDSCHITHIGNGNRWVDLLKSVDGLEIIKLEDSAHCCGFGGSYSFYYPRTSYEIAERKLERVIETGVETMLVGSPGCMMKIQTAIFANQVDLDVRHAADFLADIVVEG